MGLVNKAALQVEPNADQGFKPSPGPAITDEKMTPPGKDYPDPTRAPPKNLDPGVDTLTPPGPSGEYTTNTSFEMSDATPPTTALPAQEATDSGGPVEVDGAIEYEGRGMDDILGESQQGLVSMLQSDNELMELARKKGQRLAESRGLGGSSFAARASEGAAIDTILPLVQQAASIRSQERIAGQSLTANSSIQASNRMMNALMQDQQLAVHSGDLAKARALEQQMQREKNELASYMQARDLAVQSGDRAEARRLDELMNRRSLENQWNMNERNIETQISENDLERKFRESQQDKDIEYKKWLEESTFGHEQLLRTNQQAMDAYSDFTRSAMEILNNQETTSAQKEAAMNALREGLTGTLNLLEGLSGVDMEQFLPPGFGSLDVEPTRPGRPWMNNWPRYG
ncbi:MAG: hypothetical protein GY746_08955 [Gammaproteobacteria bacterium]|nr:hypothetical protein [Gammaproteobacteria bacterium]